MRRAAMVIRARDLDPEKVVDRVILDHDNRYRRRLVLQTDRGESLLLDLAEATQLKHGDGLALDDGAVILVEAMVERLLEIRAPQRALLTRIVWHLGNRHIPTQLDGNRVRIREDHVIADMVAQLGGTTVLISAPFDPEGGAYRGAATHHHAPHEPHPVKDPSHAAG
jgi:urease accessory protein